MEQDPEENLQYRLKICTMENGYVSNLRASRTWWFLHKIKGFYGIWRFPHCETLPCWNFMFGRVGNHEVHEWSAVGLSISELELAVGNKWIQYHYHYYPLLTFFWSWKFKPSWCLDAAFNQYFLIGPNMSESWLHYLRCRLYPPGNPNEPVKRCMRSRVHKVKNEIQFHTISA